MDNKERALLLRGTARPIVFSKMEDSLVYKRIPLHKWMVELNFTIFMHFSSKIYFLRNCGELCIIALWYFRLKRGEIE